MAFISLNVKTTKRVTKYSLGGGLFAACKYLPICFPFILQDVTPLSPRSALDRTAKQTNTIYSNPRLDPRLSLRLPLPLPL